MSECGANGRFSSMALASKHGDEAGYRSAVCPSLSYFNFALH